MRSKLLAALLCAAPLSLTSACATFEQVVPKSPRAALAEAEVMFIGAVQIIDTLHRTGFISAAELTSVYLPKLIELSGDLDEAHKLLARGEALLAADSIDALLAVLSDLALELSLKASGEAPVSPAAIVPTNGV